jgi:hypothetical protein
VLFFLAVVLWWSEPEAVGKEAAGFSLRNKAPFFCDSVAGDSGLGAGPSGHGDLEEAGHLIGRRLRMDWQQGSVEATPGRASTAASRRLPSQLVVRRPLPTSSLASVFSGWRLQVIFNLQACMPMRRPSSSGSASSRHLAPSGHVPGGDVLGCVVACGRGGDGAGPDGVSSIIFRVCCAKSWGLFVISLFILAFYVIVTPLLNECF